MPPRAIRIIGRFLMVVGGVLLLVGAAMPAIATTYIHDPTSRAQDEVDRARLNLIIVSINLGTKVSVYGTVENLMNITDLDFIPDSFPIQLAAMRLQGFDAWIIFENKARFANGEVAVVEGYYVGISYNDTTYSVVTGSSLPSIGLALATVLASGTVAPAKAFRPWWDGTSLAFEVLGLAIGAGGAAAEFWARRASAGSAAPQPGAAAAPPTPPGPPGAP